MMKAFKSALIFFLLGAYLFISTTATYAQTNTQNNNLNNPPSKQYQPVATTSGTVQLIPLGNGQYQISSLETTTANPTTVELAGCGFLSKFCNVIKKGAGIATDTVFGCVSNTFHLDIKGSLLSCSGLSTLGKIASWGLGEVMDVTLSIIKAGMGVVTNTLIGWLLGCEPGDDECITEQNKTLASGQIPAEAGLVLQLAAVNGNLASMDIPISTDTYLAHLNPLKEANAQGLQDLQQADRVFQIWKNVRNAAYALSIIMLVIVGFMIMLRTKIDPRTSVSITNAIPKIVVMLLIITFSYALAGLLLDVMRVLVGLILSLIPDVLAPNIIGRLFVNTLYIIFVPLLIGSGGLMVGAAPLALIGIGFSIIFILVIAIYLVVVMFMLLYQMVVRYAQFIIGVIFAPFIFLAFPLPSGPGLFMSWVKREAAYLLTIPIIIILVELSFVIAGSCVPTPFTGGVFGGPQGVTNGFLSVCSSAAGSGTFNPLGFASFIAPFIGLGILAMATKAPQIADDLMGVKPVGGTRGGMSIFGMFGAPTSLLKGVGNISKGVSSVSTLGRLAGPYFRTGGAAPSGPIPGGGGGGTGGSGRVGRFFRRGGGAPSGRPDLVMDPVEKAGIAVHGHTAPIDKTLDLGEQERIQNLRVKDFLSSNGAPIISEVRDSASKIAGMTEDSAKRKGVGITHMGKLSPEQQATLEGSYKKAADFHGLATKYSYDDSLGQSNIQIYKDIPSTTGGAPAGHAPTAKEQNPNPDDPKVT